MQSLHGPVLDDPDSPVGILFNRAVVAESLTAFTGLDRRLDPLLEYRDFDYWVYEHHRNLMQLVAHLQEAAPHLDPRNPVHLALFLDLAWLYLLAVVRVTEHIRGAFLSDPDRGLQEYLFGGATGLHEKRQTGAVLQKVKPEDAAAFNHLPPFYNILRELVVRLLRRPAEIQAALRYAEVASALMAARQRTTLKVAFADQFDPVPAKLVADVCGFLVASAGLSPAFRAEARAYLLAEPVAATGGERIGRSASSQRPTPEPPSRPSDLHEPTGGPPVLDASSNQTQAPLDLKDSDSSKSRRPGSESPTDSPEK